MASCCACGAAATGSPRCERRSRRSARTASSAACCSKIPPPKRGKANRASVPRTFGPWTSPGCPVILSWTFPQSCREALLGEGRICGMFGRGGPKMLNCPRNGAYFVLRLEGAPGRSAARAAFLVLCLAIAVVGCGGRDEGQRRIAGRALTTIAFVQVNYATPQTPVSTVSVPFTSAQSAGNLNVVAVGWNDTTTQVVSVTDTKGNAYQLAVGPTARTGAVTQSIYYAKNIAGAAAGANTVKVTFNAAAQWPDVRILEYSGLDQINPVDVTAAASGSSSTSSTPAVTTTNAS